MFQMDEHPAVTYRLEGEALEIAKELHAHTKNVQKDFELIAVQIAEFSQELTQEFDERHDSGFRDIYERLAAAVGIPMEQMRTFNLDPSYLDDHNIAFMKQGPILGQSFNPEDDEIDPNQLEIFEGGTP